MSRDWTREEFGITDNTPVVDIDSLEKKCERLQKQLDIAEMALKEIEKSGTDPEIKTITTLCVNNFLLAHKALKEIEELNK